MSTLFQLVWYLWAVGQYGTILRLGDWVLSYIVVLYVVAYCREFVWVGADPPTSPAYLGRLPIVYTNT